MLGTRWIEEHARLFGWMAARHDVDWSKADGPAAALAVRQAVNACLSCRQVEACKSARDGAADTGVALEFCPSRSLFEKWSPRAAAGE